MTYDDFLKKARKAAKHYWAYEGLVDDAADELKQAWADGQDPDATIKAIGLDLDLFEFGPAWGGY